MEKEQEWNMVTINRAYYEKQYENACAGGQEGLKRALEKLLSLLKGECVQGVVKVIVSPAEHRELEDAIKAVTDAMYRYSLSSNSLSSSFNVS